MPGFSNQLNSGQIAALANYLKNPAAASPAATSSAPPSLLSNAAQLYSANCARCHGVNRQGSGEIPALTSAALARQGIFQLTDVVTNGDDEMPAFAGRLTAAQITDLVNYIKNTP